MDMNYTCLKNSSMVFMLIICRLSSLKAILWSVLFSCWLIIRWNFQNRIYPDLLIKKLNCQPYHQSFLPLFSGHQHCSIALPLAVAISLWPFHATTKITISFFCYMSPTHVFKFANSRVSLILLPVVWVWGICGLRVMGVVGLGKVGGGSIVFFCVCLCV